MLERGETFGWLRLKQHTEMLFYSPYLPVFGGGFRIWRRKFAGDRLGSKRPPVERVALVLP